jgi:hypothetical protein
MQVRISGWITRGIFEWLTCLISGPANSESNQGPERNDEVLKNQKSAIVIHQSSIHPGSGRPERALRRAKGVVAIDGNNPSPGAVGGIAIP